MWRPKADNILDYADPQGQYRHVVDLLVQARSELTEVTPLTALIDETLGGMARRSMRSRTKARTMPTVMRVGRQPRQEPAREGAPLDLAGADVGSADCAPPDAGAGECPNGRRQRSGCDGAALPTQPIDVDREAVQRVRAPRGDGLRQAHSSCSGRSMRHPARHEAERCARPLRGQAVVPAARRRAAAR